MSIARLLPLLALVACAPAPAAAPPAAPPDPACLAKADGVDGTVDHVIHRCPNCALGMEGKPEHATVLGEYTAHSCSKACKKALDEDPGAVMARACR